MMYIETNAHESRKGEQKMPPSLSPLCLSALVLLVAACNPSTTSAPAVTTSEAVQEVDICSYDSLLLEANSFKSHFANADFQTLEQNFGYDKDIASYARDLIFNRQEDAVDPNAFQAWEVKLLGHYDMGELVIVLDPAKGDIAADEAFLQRGKFRNFLVCNFECHSPGKWRLTSSSCFEETGEPFHGDY